MASTVPVGPIVDKGRTRPRCSEPTSVSTLRVDGRTDLQNLIPICSRHHHVVHEAGWKLTLEPDRTLIIHQPDGTDFARTRPDLAEPTRERHRNKRRTAA